MKIYFDFEEHSEVSERDDCIRSLSGLMEKSVFYFGDTSSVSNVGPLLTKDEIVNGDSSYIKLICGNCFGFEPDTKFETGRTIPSSTCFNVTMFEVNV